MLTPEEFIIQHAALPYDSVRAHDYYIRTRKLKGRKTGVKLTGDLAKERTADPVGIKPGVFKPKVTITSKRQQDVQVRVQALQGKLKVLNTILKALIKKAEGPKTTKSTTPVATKTSAAGSKKLTAAQKQDAAKKAKANYVKDPAVQAKKREAEQRQKKIEAVKQQIKQVRTELKAAIARAREKSVQKKPAANSRRNA